ncbi:charged multivesicular body protein 2b-like [Halichondria panicea]|uniref:charged multivesicular body protein 2b-like n=1 Tax=Halichondria panicea TaxID=6063 RepID=UPI00312BAB12
MFRKPDPKEQMRAQQRVLRKTTRDLERDRHSLERQEKALETEIKKAARRGDKQACGVYAKQLVRLRQQKTKSMSLSSTITSTGHQMKAMESQAKMAAAMGSTAKAMGAMNKQMKVEDIQSTMMNFERESTKMDMAGELMDDTLDSLLAGSDDEAEEDAVITQVLDEIGIDITRKLDGVGVANKPLSHGEASSSKSDDLTDRLRQLHS